MTKPVPGISFADWLLAGTLGKIYGSYVMGNASVKLGTERRDCCDGSSIYSEHWITVTLNNR